MKRIIICFSIYVSTVSVFSAELNEKGVLVQAIRNKSSVKILALSRSIDTLVLEQHLNERLPRLSASIEPSLTGIKPDEQISTFLQSNPVAFVNDTILLSPKSSLGTKISISQKLPGGGSIQGSAEGSISNIGNSKSFLHNTYYSLIYSQPLIKDAWQWGELNHSFKIATMHDEELSFESKRALLNELSSIRKLYWTLYEKKALLSIYINELQRAEDLLRIEKIRLKLGESTVLDSLSATLNVLSAQQKVMDANIDFESSLNKIATSLAISSDTLWIRDTVDLTIPELPNDTTLLLLIEQFDPSLKVFQKISERLCLEHERLRHNVYPDLLLEAGVSHNRSGNRFFSEKESSSNAVIRMLLSYSIPVKQNYISQAHSRYTFQKNEINEKQYRIELLSDLRTLNLSWKKEINRLNLLDQIVTVAQRNFQVSQKQYELGVINRMELSDAKNKLVKSKSDLLRSRIQMKQLEIILDELTGTLFKKFDIVLQ